VTLTVSVSDPFDIPRRVSDEADCDDLPGWYWDEGITLCPASCERLDDVQDIQVALGCPSLWTDW